jgi:hypothetical protein
MPESSSIKFTIAFNDPNLDLQGLDRQAQSMMRELQGMDEVKVSRVPDPHLPEGSKSLGGLDFLMGLLAAEVNIANAQKLMTFLGDRLGGKPIELSVEGNGKKLTVKAHSREELEAAIKAAQVFLAS